MRHLFTLAVLLIACASALAAPMPIDDGETLSDAWRQKTNCTLEQITTAPHGGKGALRLRVQLGEFAIGWCHRALPEGNYAEAAGVRFYARVPEGGNFQLRLMLMLPSAGEFTYLDSGSLAVSGRDWREYFVPFSALTLERGPAVAFKPSLLSSAVKLQFLVDGATGKSITLDFDDVSFVGREEAVGLTRAYRAQQAQRLLRTEDPSWAARHPRLLFTRATLPALRRRVTSGLPAEAMARLRAEADRVCNPASPGYRAPETLFSRLEPLLALPQTHQLSGSIEGVITGDVAPIERVAFAYAVTGEKRYGEHGARLLLAAARRLPVDAPVWPKAFYYTRTFQVRTLAFGYDWLYDQLTPAERAEVRAALLGYARDIYEQSLTAVWAQTELGRVWNWAPGLMSSAGLALMAIEGETYAPDRQWLFRCERVVTDYLTFGVDEDGAGIEGPNYLGYGMGAAPEFMATLRLHGGTDLVATTHLRRSPAWMLHELLPDGRRWNNLSDGGYVSSPWPSYIYLFGRLAEAARNGDTLPGSPAFRGFRRLTPRLPDAHRAPLELTPAQAAGIMAWWWQRVCPQGAADIDGPRLIPAILWHPGEVKPVEPASVLPLSAHYRGRGLVYLRTGWGPEDIVLSLEAGPYTVITHDQADKGHFTLYAYGEDLAIDSGYGNDNHKERSTSAFAHNTVLVDGEGQAFRSYHSQTDGWIADFWHGPGLDYARVDAQPAYEGYYDSRYNRLPNRDMRRADRHVFFVRDAQQPYFVLLDDIEADGKAHTYDWLLHAPSGKTFQVEGSRVAVRPEPDTDVFVRFPPDGKGSGRLDYTFTVTKPGRYVVWARTRAGGPDPGKSDSLTIQMDADKKHTWDFSSGTGWSWEKARSREEGTQELVYNLTAGQHTLSLFTREPNAHLERLWVAPATAAMPVGTNPVPQGGFFFEAEAGRQVSPGFELVTPGKDDKPRATLEVTVAHPATWKSQMEAFVTSREGSHPRLKLTTSATNPYFLMALYPRRPGAPALNATGIPATGGVAMETRWGTTREVCAFRTGDGPVEVAGLNSDARALFHRADNAFTLVEGTRLRSGGKELVTVTGGRASVALNGGRLALRGHSGVRVRVAANGVRSVTINDREAPLAPGGEWMIP